MKNIVRKAVRLRNDLQDYKNALYIAHHLDEGYFDACNAGDDTSFLYRVGALDALEVLPAGSMESTGTDFNGRPMYDRSLYIRGVSLKERQDIDNFINQLD